MSDTILLRALGALLIVNSHAEPFYPLRPLAFGGLVGDSLFFFLSGFGLALGQAKSRRGFLAWYGRRASRILPSVVLVALFFDVFWTIPEETRSWNALLANMIGWGPANRFVGQVLAMYAPIFLILKFRPQWLTTLLGALFIPYAAIPFLGRTDEVFHNFHWLYYFHQMVFGVWLARRDRSVAPADARTALAFVAMAGILAATRAVFASGRFPDWFFAPHLLVFPFLYLLLRCARSRAAASLVEDAPRVGWAIRALAGATLETYLIHTQLIPRLPFDALGFPLGIAAFMIVSVVLGCLLAAATAKLREHMFQYQPSARGAKPLAAATGGGAAPWFLPGRRTSRRLRV